MDKAKGSDFVEWLGPDSVICVFSYLDDPADLVRATAVSQSWRKFVIENGLSKNLCKRICPEVSHITGISQHPIFPVATGLDESSSTQKSTIELIEHKVYTYLNQSLLSSLPDEKIQNTLEFRPRYWPSKGEVGSNDYRNLCMIDKIKIHRFKDERIENTLEARDGIEYRPFLYQLKSTLCIIDEIKIHFHAFFQIGHLIFASTSVQFKFGYCGRGAPDVYNYVYISPKFPMQQVNELQCFKLPRPALCIGGFVQIEFFGRVQKHSMDNWYYFCKTQVQVIGRTLSPVLRLDFALSNIANGELVLNYYSKSQKEDKKFRNIVISKEQSVFSRLCSFGKRFTLTG